MKRRGFLAGLLSSPVAIAAATEAAKKVPLYTTAEVPEEVPYDPDCYVSCSSAYPVYQRYDLYVTPNKP